MTTETADLTTAALQVGAAFELALTPHPALAERLRAITNADDDQEAAATAALMLISAQSFISGSIPGSIPDLITATHPALPAILRTRWMQMDIHAQGGLRPLAKVAHRIIQSLPQDQQADRALTAVAATAELLGASLHTDPAAGQDHPAGDALQHIPSDRQARGIFHTRQASADLLAHLTLPDDVLEQTGRSSVDRLRIADYSCGAGTLLTAAYRRASQLHRTAGGDPVSLHQRLLSKGLTGCDISPAAVAITAHNLARMQPNLPDVPQGIITLEQGPANPGQPPRLGALDLLDDSSTNQAGLTDGLTRKRHAPHSQHAVLMNPPFTKPQDTLDPDVKRALYHLNSTLGARPSTSLAYAFSMLALRKVARGGSIGLILPITAMEGAPPQKTLHPPKNINWQNLRNKLTSKFAGVTVVSIANYSEEHSSFCHNSVTADVMIVGRRLRRGEKQDDQATFVNLTRCPATTQEAADLAAEIKLAGRKHDGGHECVPITLNRQNAGYSLRALTELDTPWLMTRILDPQLITGKSNLARGIIDAAESTLRTPAPAAPRKVAVLSTGKLHTAHRLPMTTLSTLGRMHDARPTLGREFGNDYESYTQDPDQVPVLHDNNQPDQGRFLVVPADAVHTGPDQGRRAAALIRRNASRLHLKSALRFNTQASPVYLTQEPALGTGPLPSLVMCDPKYDLAAAVWLNTTPGLINLWSIASLTHNGLGRFAPTQVGAMPFLDLDAITQEQLEALNQACRHLMGQTMLPTSEAWQDEAREELDRRVLRDILGLDRRSMAHLRSLRAKWCTEPTVQAKKGASKPNKKSMTRLRRLSRRYSAALEKYQ